MGAPQLAFTRMRVLQAVQQGQEQLHQDVAECASRTEQDGLVASIQAVQQACAALVQYDQECASTVDTLVQQSEHAAQQRANIESTVIAQVRNSAVVLL